MSEAPTRLAKQSTYFRSSAMINLMVVFAGFGFVNPGSTAEVAHVIPAPAADEQAASDGQPTAETAVVAPWTRYMSTYITMCPVGAICFEV